MLQILNPTEIEKRARLVLGIDKKTTRDEVKRIYHEKILKYHPDSNKTPLAEEVTSLLIEAYDFVRGIIKKPNLLREDPLVSLAIGIPISKLEDVSEVPDSYKMWTIKQGFYDFVNPNANENTTI